jgi:hypothetical protein
MVGPGYRGYGPPRGTRGTYGPGMSFGEFGYGMNYGYALGAPYGGLGSLGYGFGYGVGPGFGPGGSRIYSSAYVTPGMNASISGYYPPFAVYGTQSRNPAVFPAPGPNDVRYNRGYGPPPQNYRGAGRPVYFPGPPRAPR